MTVNSLTYCIYTCTCSRALKWDERGDLSPGPTGDYEMLHNILVRFRQNYWELIMLTDSSTEFLHQRKFPAHIPNAWASGHRSTVTFWFNLYMSSAAHSAWASSLCLHFTLAVWCFLQAVGGLPLLLHLKLSCPFNQYGRSCIMTATTVLFCNHRRNVACPAQLLRSHFLH